MPEEMDLAKIIPERSEEAYRRGYYDAISTLWSELGVLRGGSDAIIHERLFGFISGPLLDWKKGDTSKSIPPPVFDSQRDY